MSADHETEDQVVQAVRHDHLCEHYTGRAYPQRDRGRVSAWIEVTSWHAWAVIELWTGG